MSGTTGCSACSANPPPTDNSKSNHKVGCPPRMADGRLFTDYRPRCDVHLEHRAPEYGTHDYRQYMIQNADQLIQSQRSAAFTSAYAGPCVKPYYQGTMLPEADAFRCDKVSCVRVPGAGPTVGLGTGRDYGMLPSHKQSLDAFIKEQEALQGSIPSDPASSCCGCGPAPTPSGLNLSPQQQRI